MTDPKMEKGRGQAMKWDIIRIGSAGRFEG